MPRLRALALALSLLLPGAPALAQGFTLEQVMSSPFPDNLVAAQNAPRVAWVFNAKGVRNVWVADGPKFQNARAVTRYTADDGMAIMSLRLTPDGRSVLYARGGEVNDAGESPNPRSRATPPKQQVWIADVDSAAEPRLLGDMGCAFEGCEDIRISPDGKHAVWAAKKQLWMAEVPEPGKPAAEARQLFTARGDNAQPAWSPDSRRLAFVSDRDDHSVVGIFTLGGDGILWVSPSADKDSLPRWSPDGARLAFTRRHGRQAGLPLIPIRPDPWAIYVADPATGEARELWHSGPAERDSFPELTAATSFHYAAGGRIVFASEQDGRNHLYSIADSGGQPTLLTPGEFDVEDVTLAADKKSLLYSSNQDDVERRHLWRVAVAGGKPQQVSKGEAAEWAPVEAGGQVVCLGSAATSPAMPYHLAAGAREMLAADALPKDFPSQELVTPQVVTFQSEDGLTIHGQLFVPKGAKQPGPALIFTHGGPIRQMMPAFHYMYYYHNAYAMNQYLASRGYTVLSVNYRLGVMYGRDFREVHDGAWRGSSEYKDVLAGARYLQALPYVDKARIGLWGGSYGGLLTALGLARNSDVFAAGVDFHGVHDWSAFLPQWTPGANNAPDLEQARKLAFESSPNAAIATWRSPVLLIQGDDDRNVPQSQTTDLVQRLRAQNVPFELIYMPDEIHDFLLWRTWVRTYGATADFFDRHLKGKGKP